MENKETEISQQDSINLIAQALQELDTEYEAGLQDVQTWLEQRGVFLPTWRVKMDESIARSLDLHLEQTSQEQKGKGR